MRGGSSRKCFVSWAAKDRKEQRDREKRQLTVKELNTETNKIVKKAEQEEIDANIKYGFGEEVQ